MIDRIYPRWKYHPSKDAVIVPTPEAEHALGEGWVDSPSEFAPELVGVQDCPYCKIRDRRIAELEDQIIELESKHG